MSVTHAQTTAAATAPARAPSVPAAAPDPAGRPRHRRARAVRRPRGGRLDADKYEIGGNRAAKELNAAAMRQSTSAPAAEVHPDQIESRTALRVPSGERLSFGTYFNAFPASYWRRWTVVSDVTPDRAAPRRGRDRHRLPVDWPTAAPSASTPRDRRAAEGETSLRPAAEAVRRRRLVLVRRRGRPTRTRSSRRPSGLPRCPTTGPTHGTVDHRHHHHEPARLLRQAARPARRRRRARGVPRRGRRRRAGHRQGRRLASTSPRPRRRSATSCGSSSRATSAAPAASPAASSRRSQGAPRRTCCCSTTTSSASPRASSARSPSPTWPAGPRSSAATCSASTPASRLHSFGEIGRSRSGSGGAAAARRLHDWDLAARNLRSTRWLHRRIDVDFNGWWMCLIPTPGARRDRAVAAAVHQVGRRRVRPARQGAPATRR